MASSVVDTSRSPHARLRPVPVAAVELRDAFWAPRLRLNRDRILPDQFRHLEATGAIDNFRRASGRKPGTFQGIFFSDSDVYKWAEAAAWALATEASAELRGMLDGVIDEVEAAQQPDGYLNTYFMFEREQERWTNVRDLHELYCAGHLIQAAVAHTRATGGTRLLGVARRLADHLDALFGPGRRDVACGHEEVEMALVELGREVGERRYLDLARKMIGLRGRGLVSGQAYHQDHRPVTEQREIAGHAVRAVYLCAGAADVVLETGDAPLRGALAALWQSMTTRRQYITGGIGSRWEGEAFGTDFELPDDRAYAESCAGIGALMWAWRLLLLDGDARYADQIEWLHYNAILPGLALDGETYFYQNPLADGGAHRREPWFGCACCPPNIARQLASWPGYQCTVAEREVQIHQYAAGTLRVDMPGAGRAVLAEEANYPWAGDVRITVREGAGEFALALRIPGWCETGATVAVNGGPAEPAAPGTYCRIRRSWQAGDTVALSLPMPVRRLEAHPRFVGGRGRTVLARGPVVYCLEGCDHPGQDVRDLVLPPAAPVKEEFRPDHLGGVTVLTAPGHEAAASAAWTGRLYRSIDRRPESNGPDRSLTAIPYFAWANRAPGSMTVWIRET